MLLILLSSLADSAVMVASITWGDLKRPLGVYFACGVAFGGIIAYVMLTSDSPLALLTSGPLLLIPVFLAPFVASLIVFADPRSRELNYITIYLSHSLGFLLLVAVPLASFVISIFISFNGGGDVTGGGGDGGAAGGGSIDAAGLLADLLLGSLLASAPTGIAAVISKVYAPTQAGHGTANGEFQPESEHGADGEEVDAAKAQSSGFQERFRNQIDSVRDSPSQWLPIALVVVVALSLVAVLLFPVIEPLTVTEGVLGGSIVTESSDTETIASVSLTSTAGKDRMVIVTAGVTGGASKTKFITVAPGDATSTEFRFDLQPPDTEIVLEINGDRVDSTTT